MSSCWQIRGAVDSIALFQCHASTIREKIFENTDFEQATDKFLCDLPGPFLRTRGFDPRKRRLRMGGRLKRTVIACEQALLFGRASRECASEGVAASPPARAFSRDSLLLSQIGKFARRLGSLLPCVAHFRQNNCYSATLRYTPWILSTSYIFNCRTIAENNYIFPWPGCDGSFSSSKAVDSWYSPRRTWRGYNEVSRLSGYAESSPHTELRAKFAHMRLSPVCVGLVDFEAEDLGNNLKMSTVVRLSWLGKTYALWKEKDYNGSPCG